MSRPLKATALICVLCLLLMVPVEASSVTIYKPKDYFFYQEINGNERFVTYRFDTRPWVRVLNGGSLPSFSTTADPLKICIYPLLTFLLILVGVVFL